MTTTQEPIEEFGDFVNPTTPEEANLQTIHVQVPSAVVDKLTRLGAAKNESISQFSAHLLMKYCFENIGAPVITGPSTISGHSGSKISGPSANSTVRRHV